MAAKEIIWIKAARDDRKHILNYWRKRLRDDRIAFQVRNDIDYVEQLNTLFREQARLIAQAPGIGYEAQEKPGVFIWNFKHWQMYYREGTGHIRILRLWDTRRDPAKLNL